MDLVGPAWHRLQVAHPPAWVLRHCRCVAGLALAMSDHAERQGLKVDRERVAAGALLHDIGRSVTQDVRHASIGADLLRADGWDEAVVRIVERHTGAGITRDEAAELGLPARDYIPQTLEEKMVCHADNLYTGDTRLLLRELEAKYQQKRLQHAWERIRDLHEELSAVLNTDVERLQPAPLALA